MTPNDTAHGVPPPIGELPRLGFTEFLYVAQSYRNEQQMALSLKDRETDRLARAVAALTGETLTDAVRIALAERLERERLRRGDGPRLAEQLMEIARHCAALPDLDPRPPDEIVGYDETGMWR
jgi:antitoxin VapB